MSESAALAVMRDGRRFLVTGHRSPDADALGSAVGLAVVLRSLGKDVTLYVPDALADSVSFLLDGVDFDRVVPADATFDATFVMDTAAVSLLAPGLPDSPRRGTLVVVDHHAHHDAFGDVVVRELDAAATGEVVLRLIEKLELATIPTPAATALYAALVADTGGFRYSNTRAETLKRAAFLVESGADPFQVAYKLFESYPRERLDLQSEVLRTLAVACDGRLATLLVRRETVDRCGATDDMANGLVNYARGVRGVEVAVLLSEAAEAPRADGTVCPVTRASFRSHGAVDVGALAARFGGGGHRAASGATLSMSLDEALIRVVAEVQSVLVP